MYLTGRLIESSQQEVVNLRRVIEINISSVGISESSISTSGGTRIGVPPKVWELLKAPPEYSFCESQLTCRGW